jgi:membrane-bound ClpP family serine protease
MGVEPSLFQYAKSKPQFIVGTNQSVDASKTSAQIETEFETAVGTQVAGIATTFGALFGISGFNFIGYVLEGLILIVVLIGLFAGEGAGALAIMIVAGVPILFYGNYIHAIGIQWTLVFAAAMLFLFVRQFYWKTT